MVGLMSAYFLGALHPHNRVIILEKNATPCSETSKQNGCWFDLDFSKPWLNMPFYPMIYRAIFDSEKHVSKIYVTTFFQDAASFLTTLKFGYFWMFATKNPEQFADT